MIKVMFLGVGKIGRDLVSELITVTVMIGDAFKELKCFVSVTLHILLYKVWKATSTFSVNTFNALPIST